MRRRPIQSGENTGERPGEVRHVVGDNRQSGVGEARRVAVGVEHHAGALRLEAL
jgi:hypothetical protein